MSAPGHQHVTALHGGRKTQHNNQEQSGEHDPALIPGCKLNHQASADEGLRASVNDTAARNMEVREVGMAPTGLDDDRSPRLYGATGELGFRELKPLTQGHLGVMGIAGHRIADRLRS